MDQVERDSLNRYQRRAGVLILVSLLALFGLFGARIIQINTSLRGRLCALTDAQRRGRSVFPARRGMILDARGRVVAVSRQAPDVFVDPGRVTDVDRLAGALSTRVNLPAELIKEKILRGKGRRFVLLASAIDPLTAEAVRSLHDPAVGLTSRPQRVYPLGRSMCHVLGWVGRDGNGLDGIELAFDSHLRGVDGRRISVHDATRRAVRGSSTPDAGSDRPTDGGHVVLTVDAEIQRITERALADGVARVEAESGVAIVMSARRGDVLAMAGVPAFDPSEPVTDELISLRRNRALTDPVEPGSTFKPFIVCGALAGDFVSRSELIDCHMGRFRFGKRLITDTRPHGLMDLRGIVTKSSNIGMGIIAHRMGNAVLHETLRRFGFGDRTGIEAPGEDGGLVRPLGEWTSYSTNSVAIGYEVLVTPVQLLTAFAAIVNDGVMVRPRLVKRLLEPNGDVRDAFEEPRIVRRVVSRDIARYVAQDLLVSVVENGGGWRARSDRYRVLGKTGTAKLTYEDRAGYEPGAYLGLFLGASPVANPQIVVLAMVRRPNPKIAYYGGAVAAPVVGEIIKRTLTYLDVPGDGALAGDRL